MRYGVNPSHSFSAVVPDFAESLLPFRYDFRAAALYDPADVAKDVLWNFGVVIADEAIACFRYPYFCSVLHGPPLSYVHMDRFEWNAFVKPKENPVGSDSKNLRHGRILLSGKTL